MNFRSSTRILPYFFKPHSSPFSLSPSSHSLSTISRSSFHRPLLSPFFFRYFHASCCVWKKTITTTHTINVPKQELIITFARSSGPGGQNVNKVNTKVDLRFHVQSATWLPDEVKEKFLEVAKGHINKHGEFHIQSDKTRKQFHNIDDAIYKLQQMVDLSCVEEKERIATKVPEWAIEKNKDKKKRRKDVKEGRKKKFSSDDY